MVLLEESVLSVHTLQPGGRFRVGAEADVDLAWPLCPPLDLVRMGPTGQIELVAVPALPVEIEVLDENGRLVLDALDFVDERKTRVARLPAGRRARLQLCAVSVLVSAANLPARRDLDPVLAPCDHACTGVVALAFLGALAALEALPPGGHSLEIDPFLFTVPVMRVTWVPRLGPDGRGSEVREGLAVVEHHTPAPRRPLRVRSFARPNSIVDRLHAKQKRQLALEAAEKAGILGILARDEGSVGPDFGEDPVATAMGDLDEFSNGESAGLLTFDRRGNGREEGTMGLGEPSPLGKGGGSGFGCGCGNGLGGRRSSTPDVRIGAATVRGSLDKEMIRRVVRQHLNEVKFCYEKALVKKPDLSGRVLIQLTISATGSVANASAAESTIHDASVEQCIGQAVRRWEFHKPSDGGIVVASYPFVLERAAD
jgi:hypothetical protein